jgi:hypothetical protein
MLARVIVEASRVAWSGAVVKVGRKSVDEILL